MKIAYSVPQMQLKERYEAIRLALAERFPQARVEIDVPRA